MSEPGTIVVELDNAAISLWPDRKNGCVAFEIDFEDVDQDPISLLLPPNKADELMTAIGRTRVALSTAKFGEGA